MKADELALTVATESFRKFGHQFMAESAQRRDSYKMLIVDGRETQVKMYCPSYSAPCRICQEVLTVARVQFSQFAWELCVGNLTLVNFDPNLPFDPAVIRNDPRLLCARMRNLL